MSADLEIRPASGHPWPVAGYRYETTHDSIVEGTITIDGTSHPVSTLRARSSTRCTCRRRTRASASRCRRSGTTSTSSGRREAPFGSLVWNMLDGDERQVGAVQLHHVASLRSRHHLRRLRAHVPRGARVRGPPRAVGVGGVGDEGRRALPLPRQRPPAAGAGPEGFRLPGRLPPRLRGRRTTAPTARP